MSTDPESRAGFGPYLPGVGPTFVDTDSQERLIRYGEIEDLRRALELHGRNTAAFLVEPIQGEAGYISITSRILAPYLSHTFTFLYLQNCCTASWVPCGSSEAVHRARGIIYLR